MSGMQLMQALRKWNIRAGVKVREEFFATDVLMEDGVAAGVAGIDQRTGDILCLEAGATVVATGGGMMIYPLQTAPGGADRRRAQPGWRGPAHGWSTWRWCSSCPAC